MKNKKLFAILTLVCFMMTLMPVAAFASVSDLQVQKTVGGTWADYAKVTVDDTFDVKDANNGSFSGYYYVVNEAGEGVAYTTSGAAQFQIKTPGKYEVFAVTSDLGGDIVDQLMTTPTMYNKDKIALIEANHKALILDDYAEVKVSEATVTHTIKLDSNGNFSNNAEFTSVTGSVYTLGVGKEIASDNGFNGTVFTALLEDHNTDPVKGAKLTYTTNSGYIKVQEIDTVTDRHGEAEFKLAATKAGDYKVIVKYGKASAVINVKVKEATVAGVSVVAEPTRTVALDTAVDGYTGIVFKLTDANGVVITGTDGTPFPTVPTRLLQVAVVDQPADADIDSNDLNLEWSDDQEGWVLHHSSVAAKFDEEGKYTFKVTLANGASATASVKIREFEEPVAMNLTYKTSNVDLGGTANVKALMLIDKNGTMKHYGASDLASEYTFEFVAAGTIVAAVDNSGFAISGNTDGDVTLVYPAEKAVRESLVGSKVNVMAICEELGLTATAELTVAAPVTALKYATTEAEVAVNNRLFVNTVDANGSVVKVSDLNDTNDSVYVYVLDAPENAVYSVAADIDGANNRVYVDLTASTVGEYKVQLVVDVQDDSGVAVKYLSSVETITVGGVVDNGTKSVIVLSIGSKNMINNGEVGALLAAPEIKDGRTMVPMRAGLEAFGATVNWNEADKTITAEMNGTTVVMTLDSKTYTVNGKVMTADAAPYLNEAAATTMVPAVFFTKAFGITATPLYDENGVCDVLFSK